MDVVGSNERGRLEGEGERYARFPEAKLGDRVSVAEVEAVGAIRARDAKLIGASVVNVQARRAPVVVEERVVLTDRVEHVNSGLELFQVLRDFPQS